MECCSAIHRRARDGAVLATELPVSAAAIDRLIVGSTEVPPSQRLRELACEFVARHPLRAADALQLAAAVTIREERQAPLEFVCLDPRLRQAAAREGFAVLPA